MGLCYYTRHEDDSLRGVSSFLITTMVYEFVKWNERHIMEHIISEIIFK